MQTHSTTHVLTLSDPGLEGKGRSPGRRSPSPKVDVAQALVLASHYVVVVVVVFSLYVPSRRQSSNEKRKEENIHKSFWELSCCCHESRKSWHNILEDLCRLFHAMKQAAVRFIHTCLYCIYANIRQRKSRPRWTHRSAQLVSLLVPFPLNSSGNQGSSLEMASLPRREHASEEKMSYKWCTFPGHEYTQVQRCPLRLKTVNILLHPVVLDLPTVS